MSASSLDAAAPATVGTQEQHQSHDQKKQHERADEGAAGDAEDYQDDEQEQEQIHRSLSFELFGIRRREVPCTFVAVGERNDL
jgi:hypothetical protein